MQFSFLKIINSNKKKNLIIFLYIFTLLFLINNIFIFLSIIKEFIRY